MAQDCTDACIQQSIQSIPYLHVLFLEEGQTAHVGSLLLLLLQLLLLLVEVADNVKGLLLHRLRLLEEVDATKGAQLLVQVVLHE
jgi:hypothetical protein